jgi:hypothetical protein
MSLCLNLIMSAWPLYFSRIRADKGIVEASEASITAQGLVGGRLVRKFPAREGRVRDVLGY